MVEEPTVHDRQRSGLLSYVDFNFCANTSALHQCITQRTVNQCYICEGRRESPQVRMARMQLNLVLGALSIFVTAFYLGFNVSYRMASGTTGGRFWPRASASHTKPP